MYIRVRLISAFSKLLTYQVPPSWPQSEELLYTLIVVPLQQRTVCGIVVEVFEILSATEKKFTIKQAHSYTEALIDARFKKFIQWVAAYYCIKPVMLYKRLVSGILGEKKELFILQDTFVVPDTVQLTAEQEHASKLVLDQAATDHPHPVLLYGVTGSGKSEVYNAIIEQMFAAGKSSLFLLPEVTLAVRFTQLLKKRFGEDRVYAYHSASSRDDKKKVWQIVEQKGVGIIVGVHLPVLLPLNNLGCIIVDEEHESGYQEKRQPRLNTRELALMRAYCYHIPIVLGSATPSMHAQAMVESGRWLQAKLTKRFYQVALPTITTVSLADNVRRQSFWISRPLQAAIQKRLDAGEQTLLFINRRGYSFFVQCKKCGAVMRCPHCSVSLTVHREGAVLLRCHYCEQQTPYPDVCSECGSKGFVDKGVGTQQVVKIAQELFPGARVARADLDSTTNKKKWQETLQGMFDKKIDILVGTQTITKGYHFPHLTLVGVLWAESSLNFPFYNAAEVGLQQLIQVAGRAGRESISGEVIVQTIQPHPVLKYLGEEKFEQFYQQEKGFRKLFHYPPFSRFAEVEFRHTDELYVKQCATAAANEVRKTFPGMQVLGPAQPPVKRVQGAYVEKLYLKAEQYADITRAFEQKIVAHRGECVVFFTPSPLS